MLFRSTFSTEEVAPRKRDTTNKRITNLVKNMLDEFSMSAISVPHIKKLVRHVSYQEAKALADEALQKPTAAEIEQLIQAFLAEKSLN